MGKRCIIKTCSNDYGKNIEVSYHRFPIRDIASYQRWVHSIPESLLDLPLQENTFLCSLHFTHSAYLPSSLTMKNLLRKDACPSIFTIENVEGLTKENMDCTSIEVEYIEIPSKNMIILQRPEREEHILPECIYSEEQDIQTIESVSFTDDIHQDEEEFTQKSSSSSSKKDNYNWSHEEVIAFLDAYKQQEHLISKKKKITRNFWIVISSELTKKGYDITAVQCKNKMTNLKYIYEKMKNYNKKHNNNKIWEYFDIMDKLFRKKPCMKPIVTLDSSNPNLSFFDCNVDNDKQSSNSFSTEPPLKRLKQSGENNCKNVVDRLITVMEERAIERKRMHEEVIARQDKLLEILEKIFNNRSNINGLFSCRTDAPAKCLEQSIEYNVTDTLKKIVAVIKDNSYERRQMYAETKIYQDKLLDILENTYDDDDD